MKKQFNVPLDESLLELFHAACRRHCAPNRGMVVEKMIAYFCLYPRRFARLIRTPIEQGPVNEAEQAGARG